jgi:hypothetical protein
MVNKYLIAFAAIVAVMAALVSAPGIGTHPAEFQKGLSIEYSRQNLTRIEDGMLIASSVEDLVIRNDRTVIYRNLTGTPGMRQFDISNEKMNSLKGLVIATGFIEVEGANYPQKKGLSNFTKNSIKLESGAISKTITWVSLEASEVSVPSIVRNIGAQLDSIIETSA